MIKIFKFIFANFTYKLIALLLAIIFWYIVQSEQVLEINRKVKVVLLVPEGFVVKGGNILYKDASLRGPRALLNHFSTEAIPAQIRIFADKPQTLRLRVDREAIRGWNDRIKITIYDASLSVSIDKRVEKEVLVKQNLLGVPKEGYEIEQTILTPEKVLISGAASDLQRIDSLSTEVIDINNISTSKLFESSFLTNDSTIRVIPKRIQIHVLIKEKKVNRIFHNIPIEIEGAKLPIKIQPAKVSVIIQGNPNDLNAIRDAEIQAFIDIKGLEAGVYQKKIQIKIPNNSVLIETHPNTATIEIYSKKKSL